MVGYAYKVTHQTPIFCFQGGPGWKGDETHFHHVQTFSKKPNFDVGDY
jgi:hypothetical protein